MLLLESRHRKDLVKLVEAQVIPAVSFRMSLDSCKKEFRETIKALEKKLQNGLI
jgi:hypothetical protein